MVILTLENPMEHDSLYFKLEITIKILFSKCNRIYHVISNNVILDIPLDL